MKKVAIHKTITLLLSAVILGSTWSILGRKEYGYNHDFGTLHGVSLYPLLLFPIGLMAAYGIYYWLFERLLRIKRFWYQFFCFSAMYMSLLIVAETIAYYVFNVHNLGTANYPGLPVCHCMHAPHWMQAIYFAMGPVYFVIVKAINRRISDQT